MAHGPRPGAPMCIFLIAVVFFLYKIVSASRSRRGLLRGFLSFVFSFESKMLISIGLVLVQNICLVDLVQNVFQTVFSRFVNIGL